MKIGAPLLVLFSIFFFGSAAAQAPAADWQEFERQVRAGNLERDEGRRRVDFWARELPARFPAEGFGREVFFPLDGYGVGHVGGRNGEGFRPAGYDFLDGNRHKGHPAQDIFVYDRNRDERDDRTGRPVTVRAVADGVVLSLFSDWRPGGAEGNFRGGNCIWVYHPALGMFSYYAHLRDIHVGLGERVSGAGPIATLGRTGANAYPARSPTHLHLMLLKAGDMSPADPYPYLARARH